MTWRLAEKRPKESVMQFLENHPLLFSETLQLGRTWIGDKNVLNLLWSPFNLLKMTQICVKMHIFFNIPLYVEDEVWCWKVRASNLERSIKWCLFYDYDLWLFYTNWIKEIKGIKWIKYKNRISWIESAKVINRNSY